MSEKLKAIAFWLVFLALYFNLGWGLGYYFHYNVNTKTFESASWHAKLLGGHCALFAKNELDAKEVGKYDLLMTEIVGSALWPFVFLLSLASWIVHIVFWILKLIFAGGLFKLVFGVS